MNQKNRIDGGLIDRQSTLNFTFDDHHYTGFKGDTLASALLANNITLVGRSFKYHRPRGILTSGSSEPNALVELIKGNTKEPNSRATTIKLFDELKAKSQNCWPSLKYDIQSINDCFAPFLTAGFYYKTFMWPKSFWEKVYEPLIRRAAGLGELVSLPDPDHYDRGYRHCDLLIIGAGAAGLMAGLVAGRQGLNIIIAEEDFLFGGRLLGENEEINGMHCHDWIENVVNELKAMPHVRLMVKTAVFGVFDQQTYYALERFTDQIDTIGPRQIIWEINSKHVILASGATERHIAFGNNDRPGVMLASAMRDYTNRFAVRPASRVAVFTNNDSGWLTARDLDKKGIEVTAIIDVRSEYEHQKIAKKYPNIPVYSQDQIIKVHGYNRVKAITLLNGAKIHVDGIAVSGGWNPSIHLTCQHRQRPTWNDDISGFVANEASLPSGMKVAGAAKGTYTTKMVLQDGLNQANIVLSELGHASSKMHTPSANDDTYHGKTFWSVKETKQRAWIDFQNDVTTKDIRLAVQEGFYSVEHVKRYTTLGMATDQGKTSSVIGIGIIAETMNKSIQETGTTIFRAPYVPIAIGALGGPHSGKHFRPTRETPSHQFARENNAKFVEAGAWLRSQYFPDKDESHWRESVNREVLGTRNNVGVTDVSTLGKIDVQGKDAAAFLDKVYCNTISTLNMQRCRYGIMLREDGIVMDDGTVAHIANNHFIVTTTTANAVQVYRHMEFCRQCLWPEMDVALISITEQWAQYAIAGPKSRHLLEKIIDNDHDISNTHFPYLACDEISICNGIRARLFRLSFSGEMAYELAVPARYGDALIRHIHEIGKTFNLTPYGTEALGVMRIEKGHAAGNELNGQTTAGDLGLGKLVSKKKDSIGNVLSEREGLTDPMRLVLVGVMPCDSKHKITSGSHIFANNLACIPDNDLGYISSMAYSPMMNSYIGLAMLRNGTDRFGEKLRAVNLLQNQDIAIKITSPHFYDPKGERLRG